jgi:RNA 3'-terminal phosphate cyclase (ATP)
MGRNVLTMDGSYGEGGGQILRTALTLSALTGKAIRIDNIRAHRARPGLAAQHLTAVRSVARVCRARVSGDELDSQSLTFVPQDRPIAGTYTFDVASARKGGSAGSAPLVLQTVLLPLARASGPSIVTIEGGTHLPQSPFADYVLQIWNAVLREMGIVAELRTVRTGWYPIGGGRIEACIRGTKAGADERFFRPLAMNERGPIRRIYGRSIAANLPQHIVERMAARAQALLAERGIEAHVERACETAECPGAALFLGAEFDQGLGGVCALGRRGKPAEQVASEAVEGLLGYLDSGVALDAHLGDQVLIPAALATGRSCFTVERVTPHLSTNARVIERFGCAQIMIQQRDDGTALVTVDPSR